MRHSRSLYLVLIGTMLLLLSFSVMVQVPTVLAQSDVPVAETTVAPPTEAPTGTPTTTPTVPVETPTATSTQPVEVPSATPTATEIGPVPTSTVVPPAPPVTIPEPITVVLFGTGLAALSAAAASRRKNKDSGKGGVE